LFLYQYKLFVFIFIIEEAESFNREWETRTTRRVPAAIDGPRSGASNVRVNPERRQLALPSTTDIPARSVP
jgi:hypothetical protein